MVNTYNIKVLNMLCLSFWMFAREYPLISLRQIFRAAGLRVCGIPVGSGASLSEGSSLRGQGAARVLGLTLKAPSDPDSVESGEWQVLMSILQAQVVTLAQLQGPIVWALGTERTRQ